MYPAVFLALILLGTNGAWALQGAICHSNHLQHTEDEVINNVANAMDSNSDTRISRVEVLVFFADLMGIDLGSLAHALADMSSSELINVASGFSIEKEAFVHAWYIRFHDNKDFIRAVYDVFDTDRDGLVNAIEIEGLIGLALHHGDGNGDGALERWELVTFLERVSDIPRKQNSYIQELLSSWYTEHDEIMVNLVALFNCAQELPRFEYMKY